MILKAKCTHYFSVNHSLKAVFICCTWRHRLFPIIILRGNVLCTQYVSCVWVQRQNGCLKLRYSWSELVMEGVGVCVTVCISFANPFSLSVVLQLSFQCVGVCNHTPEWHRATSVWSVWKGTKSLFFKWYNLCATRSIELLSERITRIPGGKISLKPILWINLENSHFLWTI